MGKNLVKMVGFRFSDEKIIPKIDIIAKKETRNRNQEVEKILKDFIEKFEKENGEIHLPTEPKKDTP